MTTKSTLIKNARILSVDDEFGIRECIKAHLKRETDWEVYTTTGDGEASELLNKTSFDIVISDIHHPGEMGGLGLCRYIKNRFPSTKVIILTGWRGNVEESKTAGADFYLNKPVKLVDLLEAMKKLLAVG
jgi:two-component system response regulator YesN